MPVYTFPIIMMVYGALSILFGLVDPPAALNGFFRVPAIFVFLPEKIALKAGRIFVGVLCIGVGLYIGHLTGMV